MKSKRRLESAMGQATLAMLRDYYLADLRRRNCTVDTIADTQRVINRWIKATHQGEATPLSAVSVEDVEGYITQLQSQTRQYENHPYKKPTEKPLSPFTVRKVVKTLLAFGNWLIKNDGIENPLAELTLPKVPKKFVDVLNDEEITQILKAINPRTDNGSRNYAIISLMLDSGLRISEVAHAKLANLSLDKRQLKVMGKGNKERIVPFGTQTARALMSYVNLYRRKPAETDFDQLFLALDGRPLTRDGLEQIIRRIRQSSGVKKLHAHLLRHTFAVKYLLNGGDVVTLQMILGHESMEMTRHYLSLTKVQVASRYDSFSPMDRLELPQERRFGNKRPPTIAL